MNFETTQESSENPGGTPADPTSGEGVSGGGEGDFDPSFAGEGAKSGGGSRGVAALGGLAVVAAVVVWFMFFRTGPQSAQAGMSPNDGGSQIKQFLDSGNINMMKQTLKETEKIVKQFRSYPGRTQIPLEQLRTNPFRELAPKADAPVASNKDAEREEELHKQAMDAVAELKVQSIMRGSKYSTCMINNTLYREGQQVGVLKIEQITTNTVIVSSGRYRFEVKMQK